MRKVIVLIFIFSLSIAGAVLGRRIFAGRQIATDLAAMKLVTPVAHESGPQILTANDCVQIYYDRPKNADDRLGRAYAIMLANLMGHFPRYQTSIEPVEQYQPGELDQCRANFYIGSSYENRLPDTFYADVRTTKSKMVWIGDSFWLLGDRLTKTFGVVFEDSEREDKNHLDANGNPTFYRDVLYKGEVFPKLSEKTNVGWDAEPNIARVRPARGSSTRILAMIQQPFSRQKIPWAVRHNNYYLFTEIPFSFVHEGDRYFVFADLLFDILEEKPRRQNPVAVVRFEDLHARVDVKYLEEAMAIAKKAGIRPILSLIPIYRSPLEHQENLFSSDVPLTESGALLDLIQNYQRDGGVLGWHGVTHQYQDQKNPESGRSGEDYEFWDAVRETPINHDSTGFIKSRLKNGARVFAEAGLKPHVWITPHYKASGLDSMVFGQTFNWTMGREVYFDYRAPGNFDFKNPDLVHFDHAANHMIEQMFPYEIYGDFYHQRVIPEDLGNVQLSAGMIGSRARSVDDILADAKRLSVLRDIWGSFFYHPFLLAEFENPASPLHSTVDLRRLLTGFQEMGYEFINLDDFMTEHDLIIGTAIQDRAQ